MLKKIAIPAFTDMCLWVLHDGKQAMVVDPGEAAPTSRTLAENNLQRNPILVTHHHADHTGGVAELRSATQAKVYGPATKNILEPYAALAQRDSVAALALDFLPTLLTTSLPASLPALINQELLINPFLRTRQPARVALLAMLTRQPITTQPYLPLSGKLKTN